MALGGTLRRAGHNLDAMFIRENHRFCREFDLADSGPKLSGHRVGLEKLKNFDAFNTW